MKVHSFLDILCMFCRFIAKKIDKINTARQRRKRHLRWRELNTKMMTIVMDCLVVGDCLATVKRQMDASKNGLILMDAANGQNQFLRHQLEQVIIVNVFLFFFHIHYWVYKCKKNCSFIGYI